MPDRGPASPYLTGQLLIAMPGMRDERFARSVIYMCAHTDEGAMGLVLNQIIESLTFNQLLGQLGIDHIFLFFKGRLSRRNPDRLHQLRAFLIGQTAKVKYNLWT